MWLYKITNLVRGFAACNAHKRVVPGIFELTKHSLCSIYAVPCPKLRGALATFLYGSECGGKSSALKLLHIQMPCNRSTGHGNEFRSELSRIRRLLLAHFTGAGRSTLELTLKESYVTKCIGKVNVLTFERIFLSSHNHQ